MDGVPWRQKSVGTVRCAVRGACGGASVCVTGADVVLFRPLNAGGYIAARWSLPHGLLVPLRQHWRFWNCQVNSSLIYFRQPLWTNDRLRFYSSKMI